MKIGEIYKCYKLDQRYTDIGIDDTIKVTDLSEYSGGPQVEFEYTKDGKLWNGIMWIGHFKDSFQLKSI